MVYEEGMLVVCIDVPDGNEEIVGKIGTVSGDEDGDWVDVDWGEDINGWGEGERFWSCPVETVSLAEVENE